MYGALSGAAHARGIAHDVKIVPPNRLEVFHPYMADGFELIVHWSTMWQLDVLLLATNAFHPASRPDFEAVYRRHAPALDALSSEPPDGFFEEGA